MLAQDEAFDVWTEEWGALYPEGSHSRDLLHSLAASLWLVSLVENDYIHGDLFAPFPLTA